MWTSSVPIVRSVLSAALLLVVTMAMLARMIASAAPVRARRDLVNARLPVRIVSPLPRDDGLQERARRAPSPQEGAGQHMVVLGPGHVPSSLYRWPPSAITVAVLDGRDA